MEMEMGDGSGMGCVGERLDFRVFFANVAKAMCAAFRNYVIAAAVCKLVFVRNFVYSSPAGSLQAVCFWATVAVFACWVVSSGLLLSYCGCIFAVFFILQ